MLHNFFWKFDTHPLPRDANYILTVHICNAFSGKFATSALRNTLMAPYLVDDDNIPMTFLQGYDAEMI